VTGGQTSNRTSASAPAKVILLGEHGVNRAQPALAAAVGLRARCWVEPAAQPVFTVRSALGWRSVPAERADRLAAVVDDLRARSDHEAIAELAERDVLAPLEYVLGLLRRRLDVTGGTLSLESEIAVGAGLGSGAAASCALVTAVSGACGIAFDPSTVAQLAWAGDVISHGGVASGLDASTSAFGGIVRYSVADGPSRLPVATPLCLVIADSGRAAKTAVVNARVRAALVAEPRLAAVFAEIGELVQHAEQAVRHGRIDELGRLMDENQVLLERIDVSSPEIDALVRAARHSGALGAKLSGSGGGGIVIALCAEPQAAAVAAAMSGAGGRCMVVAAGPGIEGATT
jgi:mevalonate kinase